MPLRQGINIEFWPLVWTEFYNHTWILSTDCNSRACYPCPTIKCKNQHTVHVNILLSSPSFTKHSDANMISLDYKYWLRDWNFWFIQAWRYKTNVGLELFQHFWICILLVSTAWTGSRENYIMQLYIQCSYFSGALRLLLCNTVHLAASTLQFWGKSSNLVLAGEYLIPQ